MNIGIDAKRIFSNRTGLGVYGRNLVYGLSKLDSPHLFTLYTPSKGQLHLDQSLLSDKFSIHFAQTFSSYFWRTISIKNDLKEAQLDIYHGTSNELPFGLEKLNIKSVVDIHDLCFVRFKEDYSWIDRQIFWHKAKRAAAISNKIIATSNATKSDIVKYFNVRADKVQVIYQCCDTSFYKDCSSENILAIKEKYNIPTDYILSVGTIQGRKNQKAIIRAMALLPPEDQLAVVLVGQGKEYLQELKQLAQEHSVQVHIISDVAFSDLPAVYQGAKLFVYPSIIEGFGIPVLEAMASKVPVITSQGTSMAEIIQDESCLINPLDSQELSLKIQAFLSQDNSSRIERASKRASEFSQVKFAQEVLDLYNSL